MTTYTPVMEDDHIIKFTREQLEKLLDKLDESGAQAIGVKIKPE